MADRRDFYYREKVLEDELDGGFTGLETADLETMLDSGTCRDDSQPSVYGGIMWGFAATHLSAMDFSVASGAGYDHLARRVGSAAACTVTVSHIGDVAIGLGGIPDGTTTLPTVLYERYVSIFIVFDRKLSDLRYDGYNYQVYFKRDESFHFYVSMGAEKLISAPGAPTPPAREAGKLLLLDVRISNPAGSAVYVSMSAARKEWALHLIATNAPNKTITVGKARDALLSLLNTLNDHVGGITDKHPGTDLTFTPAQVWADGTGGVFGSATQVSAGLNAVVDDLNETTEPAGSKRIGSKAQAGTVQTPNYTAPLSLVAGTVESQLTAIMNAVNGRVFRGGDVGIAGELSPASDGTSFGADAKSWDGFLRHLKVKGVVRTSLTPGTTNSYDLGETSLRWKDLWLSGNLTLTGDISVDDISANEITALNIEATGDLTVGDTAYAATSMEAPKGIFDILSPHTVVGDSVIGKNVETLDPGDMDIEGGKYLVEKRVQREAGSSPSYYEDLAGLVTECVGFCSQQWIGIGSGIDIFNPAAPGDFGRVYPGWTETAVVVSAGAVTDEGFESRAALMSDLALANAEFEVTYGDVNSSPYLGSDFPAIELLFYSTGNMSAKGRVEVGLSTNVGDPSRNLYIRFDGWNGTGINAVYYDGGVFTAYNLSPSVANNVLYRARLIMLALDKFLFMFEGSDATSAYYIMTLTTQAPIGTAYRLYPYIWANNGGLVGGPKVFWHNVALASAKNLIDSL